jgi:Fe-S-cluster containining protein
LREIKIIGSGLTGLGTLYMTLEINDILDRYRILLSRVDQWFARCVTEHPEAIVCVSGCSECCRGLFDITLLDACFLKSGFDRLPPEVRRTVRVKARRRLTKMQRHWPEFGEPYLLNYRPDEDWEVLMPEEDETRCVLLDGSGKCLVYEERPMTCRLHGAPLVDRSGEVMFDEWCSLNFIGKDPLLIDDLRWEFRRLFQDELAMFQQFAEVLIGIRINELDTFIPTALLIDFAGFDWRAWARGAEFIKD